MGNLNGKGVHTLYPQVETSTNGHMLSCDAPSKLAQKAEKEMRKIMKLNLIKKVVSERGAGRVATTPKLAIAENGQVRLNSLAVNALGEFAHLLFSMEGREAAIVAFPSLPKGFTEADTIKPGKSKDGKQMYWSFAGNLRDAGYDYKASGSQVFDLTATTITVGKTSLKAITWNLPEGALAKKESTRKARVSKIGATAPVVNGAAAKSEDQQAMEELDVL